jgi:hypothetical protein
MKPKARKQKEYQMFNLVFVPAGVFFSTEKGPAASRTGKNDTEAKKTGAARDRSPKSCRKI